VLTHKNISHIFPVTSDLICKVMCYVILIFHCGFYIYINFVIWMSVQKIGASQEQVANDKHDKH
jgi:hypothetical protein